MRRLFNVPYLVLEGLGGQSFVKRCEVSGKTLKVALYLLLLSVMDRFKSFLIKIIHRWDADTSHQANNIQEQDLTFLSHHYSNKRL